MTRVRWWVGDATKWMRKNHELIGELLLAAVLAFLLIIFMTCTLRRQEASFKGATLQAVHSSADNGSTLVTYEKCGAIQGKEFADRGSALAFAEALK